MGSNISGISRLQTLQNWAAKLIFLAKKRDHASPLLHQLHWLPVRDRIIYKTMLYVFKCLNEIGPHYLSSSLELYHPTRQDLRSASDSTRLAVQKFNYRSYSSAAEKAFSHTAPKIWNKLPSTVRSAQSLPIFKKGLKTHLFPKT